MFSGKKTCSFRALVIGGSLALSSLPTLGQLQLESVEITGSSLRRIDATTAMPITVIKVEDLLRQGVNNVEQALARVAAIQSYLGASGAVGPTTGGKSEADLRGLSGPTNTFANKTLVLLNGRRLANHAFDAAAVDLNSIPFSAIDRIEVLRDGASAIYGTDAIGGVINFVLRRHFVGLEVNAENLQPQASGSGDTQRLNMTGGLGSMAEQGFNVMASIDLRKQNALAATDRPFSATGILQGDVDRTTSGSSFPGDLNGFEPSLLDNCNPPRSVLNSTETQCRYDFAPEGDLIPKTEQITGLVRGSMEIAPEHTASVELMRARSESTSRIAPEPASHFMPATSPFFPDVPVGEATQVPDVIANDGSTVLGGVANWRQVPAGQRVATNVTTTDRAMCELTGLLGAWEYRSAVGRSKSTSDETAKGGYTNYDLMQRDVWKGLINPFGDQTAAGRAAIAAARVNELVQTGRNKVDFFDFRITKDLAEMPGGMLSLAMGFERRNEKSFFETLPIAAVLSIGLDPDRDTSGARKVNAFFAELNVPVTSTVEITAAARLDDYSDFGSTFNPKFAMRLQPIDKLVIRGSVNTGFRAPTLYEIYGPQSLVNTFGFYDDPKFCPPGVSVSDATDEVFCGQQFTLQLGGPGGIGQPISTLKPEKSRAATIGLVFEPIPSVTLGLDFWQIGVKNQIGTVTEQAVFGDTAKYGSKFFRCNDVVDRDDFDVCRLNPGLNPVAFIDAPIENLGQLKTRGIDLSANWRSGPTEYGRWAVGMEGTYVARYKYQRELGGEFIDALGRYSDNAPVFRWQHALAVNWFMGDWLTTLGQRFKSGYTDQDPSHRVSSYSLFDLSVSWAGFKNLTLVAGVTNLFDTEPPLSLQATTFQLGFDPRFTDPLGRAFSLRAGYRF